VTGMGRHDDEVEAARAPKGLQLPLTLQCSELWPVTCEVAVAVDVRLPLSLQFAVARMRMHLPSWLPGSSLSTIHCP